MTRRFVIQLGQLLLVTWGIATLLFLLTRTLPNEQELLDRFATSTGGASPSAKQIRIARQQARHRLGLDVPLFYLSTRPDTSSGHWLAWRWRWNGTNNQYHRWLGSLGRADFGSSYRTAEPVSQLIGHALRYTVPLTLLAAVLLVGLVGPLGMWLAAQPRNRPGLVVLFALDALPLFVVALLVLLLLANPDFLPLFPAYGLGAESDSHSFAQAVTHYLSYLALPVASLVLTNIAEPVVQLASSLRHEMRQDYMLAARAKGLSVRQAIRRHALRNAVLPGIALFTDLLPNLLAGSVVVELIFALPGMGRLLAEAAAARDYPELLGGVLVVALTRQLSLWLADGLYQLADPRIRTRAA
jgi:peptide/nickel transport system permease protein